MLQLQNISKSYPTASGSIKNKVLDQLSLSIEKGESIAIVGPSGTGKTTLLNIIGTLDKADEGTLLFEGQDLMNLTSKTQPDFRNRKIGMVFQLHHLLPQCTLWENILLPTIPQKLKNGEAEKRAEQLLKRTGIWEQRFQKPTELSGGECQRAAVIRALINQPSLILADEPTGALDEENAEKLADLLLELNKEMGTTLIVVTHSSGLAAKMDKMYRLENGKLHLS
ncbi:MAG: ABC transporter ATP-binding protein [Prolixibacteraceae bacterium]|jgi:lipoprotein-releasing system ATP-binding protein|nr:ABC transporter ATP-binding protein [Prolixibacteraceae bacterium]